MAKLNSEEENFNEEIASHFTENDVEVLMKIAKNEKVTIDSISMKAEVAFDNFRHYINSTFTESTKYKTSLFVIINTLSNIYKLKTSFVYFIPKNFNRKEWGNIYWTFFHYASILIQHAFFEKKIHSMLNLPLVLFNIDEILICSICKHHYTSIKHSDAVKETIKEISFGSIIAGVYKFHNIINSNITMFQKDVPPHPFFTPIDFIELYKCSPNLPSITTSREYVNLPCLFQSKIQAFLTNILNVKYYIGEQAAYKLVVDLLENVQKEENVTAFKKLVAQTLNQSNTDIKKYLRTRIMDAQTQ